jgi:hypothetical protein
MDAVHRMKPAVKGNAECEMHPKKIGKQGSALFEIAQRGFESLRRLAEGV